MENVFRKDVMEDIKWERDNIQKQIELLEPMTKELHRSSGMRFLSNSGYLLSEFISWLMVLGALAWLAFLFRIPPFYNWSRISLAAKNSTEFQFSQQDFDIVEWSIRGIVVLIAILFVIIARQLAKLRHKGGITQTAGKTIKDMQIKLQERKQKLDEFESKYNYLLSDDVNTEPDAFNNPLTPPDGDIIL